MAKPENERERIALEPCPFCGSEAIRCQNHEGRLPEAMIWIMCKACHASPGDFPTDERAFAAWNRRAPLPQQGDIAQRETGEPVGWMLPRSDWSWTKDPAIAARWQEEGWEPQPVYAAPPTSQALAEPVAQSEVAKAIEDLTATVAEYVAQGCYEVSGFDLNQVGALIQFASDTLRPEAPTPAEAQARVEAEDELRGLQVDADLEIIDGVAALMARGQLTQPRNVGLQIRKCVRQIRALLSGSTPKPPMTMKVDQDWLRRHTETDPDVDVEAWGSTPKPAGVEEGWVATHRHVKTGGLYRLVSDAVLQTATPCEDDAYLALYQGADGKFWVRPADEFKDGRFAALTAALSGGSDAKAD